MSRFNLALVQAIRTEQAQWADRNFPNYQRPELGVIEELGEFAHQILKKGQGIRKTSLEDLQDALADACIFYFHLSTKQGHVHYESPEKLRRSTLYHLSQATCHAGYILRAIEDGNRPDTIHMIGLWDELMSIAINENWEIERIVLNTWEDVKKRDFVLYPLTGLPPVE